MHYIPFGKANTRPFQWLLKRIWDWDDDTLDDQHPIPAILGLQQACARWEDPHWPFQGVPMHREIQEFSLHTDASAVGWGATLVSTSTRTPRVFSGRWNSLESRYHSNLKELLAVRRALIEAALQSTLVQVHTDNTTVVAVLNRQGTVVSLSLQAEAFELFEYLQQMLIAIRAAHIPGILNLNADILSRPDTVYATEWSLDKSVFRQLCASFSFTPMVDAFATAMNAQIPSYFSPVPDENAAALDAFNQNWNGWALYMFPPFTLLSQVIQKLAVSTQLEVLLIYPSQPRRAWYPALMALQHTTPARLPLSPRLLRQPHNSAQHPRLSALNLHAATFSVP
jgi:hypothetical protein